MATINVQDYGATPDDGSDDYSAIQNAIDDAASGDTIYFPAGTYRSSGELQYWPSNNSHPTDGITFEGDGESSVIQATGSSRTRLMRIEAGPNPITNCTVQNLKFDGGSLVDMCLGLGGTGLANSLKVTNCWFTSAVGSNLYLNMDNVTIEWCTLSGAINHHGIAGAGGDGSYIHHCYAHDNDGIGIDSSGATNFVIEDCVMVDNLRGSKIGGNGAHTVYRRCRFKDSNLQGFISTAGDAATSTIEFEDIISEGSSGPGFYLTNGHTYKISGVLYATDNDDDQILVNETATLDASNGEVRASVGTGSGNNLIAWESSSVLIDQWTHPTNQDIVDNTSETITITNESIDDDPQPPSTVPTASEVGAGRSDTTSDSTSETISTSSAVIQTR